MREAWIVTRRQRGLFGTYLRDETIVVEGSPAQVLDYVHSLPNDPNRMPYPVTIYTIDELMTPEHRDLVARRSKLARELNDVERKLGR